MSREARGGIRFSRRALPAGYDVIPEGDWGYDEDAAGTTWCSSLDRESCAEAKRQGLCSQYGPKAAPERRGRCLQRIIRGERPGQGGGRAASPCEQLDMKACARSSYCTPRKASRRFNINLYNQTGEREFIDVPAACVGLPNWQLRKAAEEEGRPFPAPRRRKAKAAGAGGRRKQAPMAEEEEEEEVVAPRRTVKQKAQLPPGSRAGTAAQLPAGSRVGAAAGTRSQSRRAYFDGYGSRAYGAGSMRAYFDGNGPRGGSYGSQRARSYYSTGSNRGRSGSQRGYGSRSYSNRGRSGSQRAYGSRSYYL